MTTLYPTAIDDFSNPTPEQSQQEARTHSQQHGDLNDAVEAIQAHVGVIGVSVGTLESRAGTLRVDLADTTDAAKGAALIGYKQSGTSASARTALAKLRERVSVADFGVVGDGTNEGVKLQAAITYVDSLGGGELWIPPGYTIGHSNRLVSNNGVLLRASTCNDLSSNTNGSGDSSVRIVWLGGVDTGYQYTVKPAVVGNAVWGGGSENIEWDGASNIAGGVHLDNTKFALFDGRTRSHTYTGVAVTSASGAVGNFSQQNYVRRLEWVYGASAATQNANGLTIAGNGSTVPGTQQRIGRVTGIGHSGYAIDIAETDNCYIEVVSCAFLGTGKSVKLRSAGFGPADSNVFGYVAGAIDIDAGANGNRFLHANSEGGGISTGSAATIAHYSVLDYVNGGLFETAKFRMSDNRFIPAKDWTSVAGGTDGVVALLYPSKDMADGVTTTLSYLMAGPFDWNDGTITGLTLFLACDAAAAGNVRLNIKVSTITNGSENMSTPEYTESFTVTPSASQYVPINLPCNFATPKGYSYGQMIAIVIERVGADAADTKAATVKFLGASVVYKSSGPHSSGSGTYSVPAMGT